MCPSRSRNPGRLVISRVLFTDKTLNIGDNNQITYEIHAQAIYARTIKGLKITGSSLVLNPGFDSASPWVEHQGFASHLEPYINVSLSSRIIILVR